MKNTTELKNIILEMYSQLVEEAEVILPGQEDKVKKLEVNPQGPKKAKEDEEEPEATTSATTPKAPVKSSSKTTSTPAAPATTQPVKPGQPKKPGEGSTEDSDAEDENLLEIKEERRIYQEVMKRIRNLNQ